jgi:hypothetical protein
MTRYIGMDVHKRFIEVCILDAAGKIVLRGQVPCERRQLESFCRVKLKKTESHSEVRVGCILRRMGRRALVTSHGAPS